MSGSIKWMIYKADDGNNYATRHDESNGEALGFDDYDALSTADPIPKGLRMRRVNAVNTADSAHRRTFAVGKVDSPAYVTRNFVFASNGSNWQVTSSLGERVVRPFHFDTALQDGDPT